MTRLSRDLRHDICMYIHLSGVLKRVGGVGLPRALGDKDAEAMTSLSQHLVDINKIRR